MTSLTVPHTNGSTPHTQPWLTQSVQQFFSAINWDDNPPELQEIKRTSVQGTITELSMTLTVSQFFSAVNWDGAAIASVPESMESAEPEAPAADELTLEDFSGLF